MKKKVFLTLCLVLCVFTFSSCQNEVKVAPVDVEKSIAIVADSIDTMDADILSSSYEFTYVYANKATNHYTYTQNLDFVEGKAVENQEITYTLKLNEDILEVTTVSKAEEEPETTVKLNGEVMDPVPPKKPDAKPAEPVAAAKPEEPKPEYPKAVNDFVEEFIKIRDEAEKTKKVTFSDSLSVTALDHSYTEKTTQNNRINSYSIQYTGEHNYNLDASYLKSEANVIFKSVNLNGQELSMDLIEKYHDTLKGLI